MIPWSFEVYRPRGIDCVDDVVEHVRRVLAFSSAASRPRPDFCSVTTRAGNWSLSADIAAHTESELGLRSVLHVCWSGEYGAVGRAAVLDRIASTGLWGVLALRGDAPGSGEVAWLRAKTQSQGGERACTPSSPTGEDAAAGVTAHFQAGLCNAPRVFVAAHPGWWPRLSPNGEQHTVLDEARWVARKVKAAGGDASVITQVCFDTARVVAFVVALRSLGCVAPVHAGVMVAKDAAAMCRVASMAGIEVPPDIAEFTNTMGGAQRAGAEAAEVWRLAEASGSPLAGIHFFGMNNTELLCESVRVMDSIR